MLVRSMCLLGVWVIGERSHIVSHSIHIDTVVVAYYNSGHITSTHGRYVYIYIHTRTDTVRTVVVLCMCIYNYGEVSQVGLIVGQTIL